MVDHVLRSAHCAMPTCSSVLAELPFYLHLETAVSLVPKVQGVPISSQLSLPGVHCKLSRHYMNNFHSLLIPSTTSVGATTGITETAATFSAGGFSNIFARPSYQSAAVSSYLTTLGKTNQGKFNTSGRAFPDISAQGENVEIAFEGEAGLVDGTSCASPIFASVIALLNDQLITAGKSPLGFLNPFLYSAAGAAALNDITTGQSLYAYLAVTLILVAYYYHRRQPRVQHERLPRHHWMGSCMLHSISVDASLHS